MHLFQVGAGSGGMAVLDFLARDSRITRITLVEPDVYAPHNVYRHLFPLSSVGRLKGELAEEWIRAIRPDVAFDARVEDITDPARQAEFARIASACDVGVCAADNEAAKFAFDALMRGAGKPWTLGEVLSGGIGGWVHRFAPGAACYGCVASHLKREVTEQPSGPPPDYSNPTAAQPEATIPASKASIAVIAGMHALVTLEMLGERRPNPLTPFPKKEGGTEPSSALSPSPLGDGGVGSSATDSALSILFSLQVVPGVFDTAFRAHRLRIPRAPTCLTCGESAPAPTGNQLDAALDDALARLGAR
ncbi:thiamine biosynthesis protein ThiF [Gemmata sp. SH-PL17]|uniref:HesA/MoeB/ThiF family protein n=1 Tax=Gemmata sp. SH-PL17 TaxID=1630693 RepID=UPI00078DAF3A|nr:ThiF family adenylyltransferase [Gemmata sp. SH-PL17]AMV27935.1 thiamine biosynthesis protein ThiF [Gemmata sp. SH-PL17]